MRSRTLIAAVGVLVAPLLLGACFGGGSSPVAATNGSPCWAGTWLVRLKTETATETDGSAINVSGGSGEVMTFHTNGTLFVDYGKAGALVGTAGSGPIAVQYQGTEDARLTVTGSASGTLSETIVSGAEFTTVSDGQSNSQTDQPGGVETDRYTCSGSSLTLQNQGSHVTLIRTG